MKLKFLPANQAWVVIFGDQIIDINGRRFFEKKLDAVLALESRDLGVTSTGDIFPLPQ